MKKILIHKDFFLILSVLFLPFCGHGAIITWTNTGSGNWSDSANWSPRQVPSATDTAIVNVGTVAVTTSSSFAILNLGNATLAGALNVASGAVMNWTNGSINYPGSLTVSSGGTLNISGSANKVFYVAVTNYGTITWSGSGSVYAYNDGSPQYPAAIYNQAGALFDIQSDAYINNNYGKSTFNNAGTVRKSAGTGTTSLYTLFNNIGVVNVQSGNLALEGGGNVGGQYTTVAGTGIKLDGGAFLQVGAPVFTGAGVSLLSGNAVLTLTSDVIPGLALTGGNLALTPTFQGGSITNLTLGGVTLTGTNFVGGVLNWTNGSINYPGSLTVMGGGTLNISGSANKVFYVAVTNYGTVTWSGSGSVYAYNDGSLQYPAAIYNQAGALFDIQTDSTLNNNYGKASFNNAGTVRKSAGTGTTSLYTLFNNTGVVNVQSGTLALEGGGNVGGQYTTVAGTAIKLDNGAFLQVGAPVFSGAGVSQLSGNATLTLTGDVIPGLVLTGGYLALKPTFQGGSITNLTLGGVTLTGTNFVGGTLNWTNGSITYPGSLTILGTGTLNISGSANKVFYVAVTNYGIITWSGSGSLLAYNDGSLQYPAAIYNQGGALFDIQTDATLNNNYSKASFNNAGTVRKSAGTGTTLIYPLLNNAGVIIAQSGVLSFQSGYLGTATSTLASALSGTNAATSYGKIQFTVATNILNGKFMAITGSYRPPVGSSFLVLSFVSTNGDFTSMEGLDLGGGLRLYPRPAATSLSLVATTYPVTSAPRLTLDKSFKGHFVEWPANFTGWTLQTATNLLSTWSTLSAAGTNNTVFPMSGPQQFFRLTK